MNCVECVDSMISGIETVKSLSTPTLGSLQFNSVNTSSSNNNNQDSTLDHLFCVESLTKMTPDNSANNHNTRKLDDVSSTVTDNIFNNTSSLPISSSSPLVVNSNTTTSSSSTPKMNINRAKNNCYIPHRNTSTTANGNNNSQNIIKDNSSNANSNNHLFNRCHNNNRRSVNGSLLNSDESDDDGDEEEDEFTDDTNEDNETDSCDEATPVVRYFDNYMVTKGHQQPDSYINHHLVSNCVGGDNLGSFMESLTPIQQIPSNQQLSNDKLQLFNHSGTLINSNYYQSPSSSPESVASLSLSNTSLSALACPLTSLCHTYCQHLLQSQSPPPQQTTQPPASSTLSTYSYSSSSSSLPSIDSSSSSSIMSSSPPASGNRSQMSMFTLDSDYETQHSETSTVSSSPVGEVNYPPLDEAVLADKFAKLGFSKYTVEPPSIKVNFSTRNSTRDPCGNDDDDDDYNNNNNNKNARRKDDSISSEDDENDLYGGKTIRAPFIRSTSLKTGKTPPNTPGRGKKAVRFADALGLEFEYVKLISQDELPIVPRSAYQDLKLRDSTSTNGKSNNNNSNINNGNGANGDSQVLSKPKPQRKISPGWQTAYNPNLPNTLVPEFLQPIASANFCDRVRSQCVCLENCIVSSGAGNISVTCVIRVLNIAFEKSVTVRHTLTEWQTSSDSLASYLPNSCDGWSDKFSATFSIRSVSSGGALVPGQRILFAVRYTANSEEYWDNNMGLNYSLIYQA